MISSIHIDYRALGGCRSDFLLSTMVLTFTTSLYYGFFHSISAFCNAGFALFDNSLESYATNPLVHGTISVLVILGGLGFIVLKELKEMISKKNNPCENDVHTKIVLTTSIF